VFDKIQVSWTAPHNGHTPITSFLVEIRQQDGLTFSTTSLCDGADATTMSNKYCQVDIGTLRSDPFLLDWGEVVGARVSAINIKGESLKSDVGEGGTIADIPPAPINLASTAVTSASVIGLSWEAAPTFSGLPVLDYGISYDKGLGDGSIYILEERITQTTFTYTSVVQGITYTFYVQARSEFSYSEYSTSVSILAA
jgi:hypothetical protein